MNNRTAKAIRRQLRKDLVELGQSDMPVTEYEPTEKHIVGYTVAENKPILASDPVKLIPNCVRRYAKNIKHNYKVRHKAAALLGIQMSSSQLVALAASAG